MSKAPPPAYYWANFAAGTVDERTEPPATDEQARAYIPQDAATQAHYDRLRDQGTTPAGAIRALVTQALDAWHPPRPCPLCFPAPRCSCWRSQPEERRAA